MNALLQCGASIRANVAGLSFLSRAVAGPSRAVAARTIVTQRSAPGSIPPTRPGIETPEQFLKSIGRSSETKVTEGNWAKFWALEGLNMKALGLSVKDRKYILWAMNKFRLGLNPADYQYNPKPKKKVRGWGPAVQDGKRIRSRRKR